VDHSVAGYNSTEAFNDRRLTDIVQSVPLQLPSNKQERFVVGQVTGDLIIS